MFIADMIATASVFGSMASASAAAGSAASSAASVASALSTAATIAGVGMSAYGQYQQGQERSALARANAEQLRVQEKQAEDIGLYQEGIFRERAHSVLEKQAVAYGAAGISGSEGSPLEIAAMTGAKIERDALAIGWNARATATGYGNQANVQDYMADIYGNAGMWAAGTTFLSGLLDNPYMRRGVRNTDFSPLSIA
jgi:hypothetical protein